MKQGFLIGVLALAALGITVAPVSALQLGAGLHYQRTIDDFGSGSSFSLGGFNNGNLSQDDFALFGTVTFPVAMIVKIEGNLEWMPDYLGTDEHLFQPAAYGLVNLGMLYGGAGIGIGYLTGDNAGWATNPFYALRAGVEFGVAGFALDAFASYRFQSANFFDGAANLDLNALTLSAQVKFGI